ncbi:hypothetical protein EDC01DRAFT_302983 [Geopyxis carbonaria]|nr:hypothetical protein EDC01DRAFT_302983 [Geopyxis carbonaria]
MDSTMDFTDYYSSDYNPSKMNCPSSQPYYPPISTTLSTMDSEYFNEAYLCLPELESHHLSHPYCITEHRLSTFNHHYTSDFSHSSHSLPTHMDSPYMDGTSPENSPISYASTSVASGTPMSAPADIDETQSIEGLDLDMIRCFYPEVVSPSIAPSSASTSPTIPRSVSLGSNSRERPHSSSRAYFQCDHPGCRKVYPRLCDLRKHKKRHLKPFPCRNAGQGVCDAYFSTEKDRDRHERSKHRRNEHLTCAVCGHRTARKDNMKDHVRRRHGDTDLDGIMAVIMGARP